SIGRKVELLGHHDGPADVGALAHVDLADPADRAAVLLDTDVSGGLLGLERQARGERAGARLDARQRDRHDQRAGAGHHIAAAAVDVEGHGYCLILSSTPTVIPGKAGSHPTPGSAERWVPAFAGTTPYAWHQFCYAIPAAFRRSGVNGACRSLMPVASKIALA